MGMTNFSNDESRWSLSGVEVPVGFVIRKIRHSLLLFNQLLRPHYLAFGIAQREVVKAWRKLLG